MKSRILVLTVAFTIVLSFSQWLSAQEETPNLIIVYYFKAKAGMAQQFEAALRAHMEWLVEAECQWPWNTWKIVTGDGVGEYVITSAFHTWADFDENEEFFNKQVKNFQLNAGPLLESVECHIDEVDFTQIRMPIDFDYINLLEAHRYDIKPDQMGTFNEVRSKIHQAIVQVDWPVYYNWEIVRSGGTVPVVYLIIFHKDWAGLKGPEKNLMEVLAEVYGTEEAKSLLDRLYSSVTRIEKYLAKYLPHLSFNAGKIGWRRQ